MTNNDRVRQVLMNAAAPMTLKAIHAQLPGMPDKAAYFALYDLYKRGEVKRFVSVEKGGPFTFEYADPTRAPKRTAPAAPEAAAPAPREQRARAPFVRKQRAAGAKPNGAGAEEAKLDTTIAAARAEIGRRTTRPPAEATSGEPSVEVACQVLASFARRQGLQVRIVFESRSSPAPKP